MNNDIKKYYEHEGISQSKLKDLNLHPKYFKGRDEETEERPLSGAFLLGSAVDCKLTTPELYDEQFAIIDVEKPTGQLGYYINRLLLGDTAEEAYDTTKAWNGGKLRDNIEKFKENFNTSGINYFNCVKKAEGKHIMSLEEKNTIDLVCESLLTSDYTKDYFQIPNGNIEIYKQYPIYWEYNDVKCKSLLDFIEINHDDKTIQPLDLKTTGDSVSYFPNSVFKYRYDIQAAFYTYAVGYSFANTYLNEKYTILPFKFIVESTKYPGTPEMFKCSDELLAMGINGRIRNGNFYKGFDQLITEYKWHLKNDKWDYKMDTYLNNGETLLTVN